MPDPATNHSIRTGKTSQRTKEEVLQRLIRTVLAATSCRIKSRSIRGHLWRLGGLQQVTNRQKAVFTIWFTRCVTRILLQAKGKQAPGERKPKRQRHHAGRRAGGGDPQFGGLEPPLCPAGSARLRLAPEVATARSSSPSPDLSVLRQ